MAGFDPSTEDPRRQSTNLERVIEAVALQSTLSG